MAVSCSAASLTSLFLEIEDIDPETNLAKVGGEQLIYDRLDARYPQKEAQGKIGETLDGVFKLRVKKRECTDMYVGRVRQTFNCGRRVQNRVS